MIGRALAPVLLCAITGACAGDLEENLPPPAEPAAKEAPPLPTEPRISVHFDPDIQKDIDALGCSGSSCHGSGQGGFLLAPQATGAALDANFNAFKARASAGATSKVLVKATGGESHAGGPRMSTTDATHARWLAWIEEGTQR